MQELLEAEPLPVWRQVQFQPRQGLAFPLSRCVEPVSRNRRSYDQQQKDQQIENRPSLLSPYTNDNNLKHRSFAFPLLFPTGFAVGFYNLGQLLANINFDTSINHRNSLN